MSSLLHTHHHVAVMDMFSLSIFSNQLLLWLLFLEDHEFVHTAAVNMPLSKAQNSPAVLWELVGSQQ